MALVNPNIAMSFRMPEFTPRNALAEYAQIQQIQGGQRQAEVADLQLQRIRQTDEALEKVRQIAMQNGGPSDLNEIAKAYLGAPNQEMQQFGLGLLQKMKERADFDRTYKSLYPEAAAAAPTNAMASTSMPTGAPALDVPAGAQPPGDYTSTQAMGRVPGVVTTPIPESPPMNAMAPAAVPAAPVNALAAPASKTVDQLRREIMLFSQSADPRAKAMVDVLKGQLTEALKPYVVGGRLVTGGGKELYAAPDKLTDLQSNFEYAKTPAGGNFKGSLAEFKVLATPKTSTTIINSPTAKSLSEPVGKRVDASLAKAEGAAGLMENANMIREALNTGNIIAGPLAGPRTKIAQVLGAAGAGDKEKLQNTLSVTKGLAGLTLESRGELKGQGQITDVETKLLERARSGDMDLTLDELQQVVNISQRLAKRLWENHESLLKTMEKDPAAAGSIEYYRPTGKLASPVGVGKSPAQQAKETGRPSLANIFGQPPAR